MREREREGESVRESEREREIERETQMGKGAELITADSLLLTPIFGERKADGGNTLWGLQSITTKSK